MTIGIQLYQCYVKIIMRYQVSIKTHEKNTIWHRSRYINMTQAIGS